MTKGAHQSAKLSMSPNLYLDRLFLLKVHKISAKKVERSYVSWHWRLILNLMKNWFVVSKLTRIWWIFIRALKILKNLDFDWFLAWKVCNFWSKFDLSTKQWCKTWRKTDLWFGKQHGEFGKFSPEHLKVGTQNWDFYGVFLSQVENLSA